MLVQIKKKKLPRAPYQHRTIELATLYTFPYIYFFFQAVTYEQHGFLEQAQATYELSMFKAREDMAVVPSPGKLQSEMKLWEERWIR